MFKNSNPIIVMNTINNEQCKAYDFVIELINTHCDESGTLSAELHELKQEVKRLRDA